MTNLTFDWQIDEFMVYCQSKQLRPKTMQSYEQALRLFARWCEEERRTKRMRFENVIGSMAGYEDEGSHPPPGAWPRKSQGRSEPETVPGASWEPTGAGGRLRKRFRRHNGFSGEMVEKQVRSGICIRQMKGWQTRKSSAGGAPRGMQVLIPNKIRSFFQNTPCFFE